MLRTQSAADIMQRVRHGEHYTRLIQFTDRGWQQFYRLHADTERLGCFVLIRDEAALPLPDVEDFVPTWEQTAGDISTGEALRVLESVLRGEDPGPIDWVTSVWYQFA